MNIRWTAKIQRRQSHTIHWPRIKSYFKLLKDFTRHVQYFHTLKISSTWSVTELTTDYASQSGLHGPPIRGSRLARVVSAVSLLRPSKIHVVSCTSNGLQIFSRKWLNILNDFSGEILHTLDLGGKIANMVSCLFFVKRKLSHWSLSGMAAEFAARSRLARREDYNTSWVYS